MTTIDNSIESLRPEVQPAARIFFHVTRDDLSIDTRCLETRRSRERQAELLVVGKSQLKVGFHNYGLALDFGVFVKGVYQTDDRSGLYTRCGYIAKALGWRWGGDWAKFKDFGHIEANTYTLAQLEAAIAQGLVTT